MSNAQTTGIGWKYAPEEHSIFLLFEVSGMATDERGKPCPAGMKINIHSDKLIKGTPTKNFAEKCNKLVSTFLAEGIEQAGIAGDRLTALTWEDFHAKGYDEE